MNKLNQTLNKSILFILGSLLLLVGIPLLYAEESVATTTTDAASAVSQPDTIHRRGERIQNFLENHPKMKERMDANDDGTVDKQEMKHARKFLKEKREHRRNDFRRDQDNNPPGPRGGRGTNWERGDFKGNNFHRDRDNNPPGPRGGQGTNWENRPGPQGGPGASPDRGRHGKRG